MRCSTRGSQWAGGHISLEERSVAHKTLSEKWNLRRERDLEQVPGDSSFLLFG